MKHSDVMTTLQKMNQNQTSTNTATNEAKQQDDYMKRMELERQRKAGL